jgi:hypothetical protein
LAIANEEPLLVPPAVVTVRLHVPAVAPVIGRSQVRLVVPVTLTDVPEMSEDPLFEILTVVAPFTNPVPLMDSPLTVPVL